MRRTLNLGRPKAGEGYSQASVYAERAGRPIRWRFFRKTFAWAWFGQIAFWCVGMPALAGPVGPITWNNFAFLGGGWGRMVVRTNGHWIAVNTEYPPGTNSYLRISRSTDRARTWATISEVREPGRTLDNGELVVLPDGTLLLTMRSLIPNQSYQLPVYASSNGGLSWSYRSTIDTSEGQTAQQGKGLWEPDFCVLDDGRLVVTYSNEKPTGYSQVISLRVSTNAGVSWGPESWVVAQPGGGSLRPGMPQMARMANGEYILVYEIANLGRADVYCKFSPDGMSWPDGLGTRVPCHHAGPFVTALTNGLVLISSCENEVSFSEDYGRTWQRIEPPAWEVGYAWTWPALYQTRSNEVAVMAATNGVRLRFGALLSRPQWPNPWTANFDDGTDAGWARYGGNFGFQNGRYVLNNAGTNGKAIAGDGFWTDGTLEVDLMLTSAGNAGVMFRTTNPDYEGPDHAFGYYAGLDTAGFVLLGRMSNAWTFLTNRPLAVTTNVWYRLKVSMEGSLIRVFVNDMDTPRFARVDTNFTRGQIGVRAFQCNAQFDNVSFSNAVPLRLEANLSPAGFDLRWPATAATVKLFSRPGLAGPAERTTNPVIVVNGYSRTTLPVQSEALRTFWLQAD